MFHQQRGTRGGAVVVLGDEALAVQVDDDFPWLPVLRDQPARRALARRVGCAERMIEHAAEIRQEFLVMHDAAPGAATEFQPASGGVMIGTGPQRCAPVQPGEEVRAGPLSAGSPYDLAAA